VCCCVCHIPVVASCLGVSCITNLCTASTTQNTAENDNITSHAQDASELQSNVLLTGIYQLLVATIRRSDFSRSQHCLSQMRSPESTAVLEFSSQWPNSLQEAHRGFLRGRETISAIAQYFCAIFRFACGLRVNILSDLDTAFVGIAAALC